ncbi:MAG: hypothetical protein E7587_06475 [Ruminococcaceae bacterium]|nr:hypothetical protein [Oscillospiraceae bacterium]
MELLCDNFKVLIDDITGAPVELISLNDPYKMNWIRNDYPWGTVIGIDTQQVETTDSGVCVRGANEDKTLGVTVKRYVENEKYRETYIFENLSDSAPVLLNDTVGIVFPYNDLFDKKENMLHTRCNSHIWCADDICNIQSVKLDGQSPYLIQRASLGSFSGYGLLCDACAALYGSFDRGSIVLYPQERVLECGESASFAFEFYFSDKRESISYISADRYSGFIGDKFSISIDWYEKIESLSAEVCGERIEFQLDGNKATTSLSFNSVGEKTVKFQLNGKKTFICLNVLDSIENILECRVRFITEKQQYEGEDQRLNGAYLIYDRETDSLYYNKGFADHNCARERLSMGALVAASLVRKYDPKVVASLKKHRLFLEREILDVNTGLVKDGIDSSRMRLYNFPWVSTYYLEWYRFSKDTECLKIAARVLHKYYELGGAGQESPCIEAFEILEHLKNEGLDAEYEQLKKEFISHADSIYERRTKSTSSEVACANGMMNLMSTFLAQAYLITGDKKYLTHIDDLLKISESFYDKQPDYRMFGIALRCWDMYWFGKKKSYGDTYPQWLSALTAQMYHFCDSAMGTDHSCLIRENLLGNCCVYFPDGFAACGYLYPKRITVFSSKPDYINPYRPTGVWQGKRFDEFANDQDWALYYAAKYLSAQ